MTEFILRKALTDTVTTSTAKEYKRALEYFWAWANAAYGVKGQTYPIPLSWMITFVHEHIDGIPLKRREKIRKQGARVTGPKVKLATIRNLIVPLSIEHTIRGVPSPTRHPAFKFLMKRLRRRRDQKRRVLLPITSDVLVQMLAVSGDDLRGERDKAMLLVGFAGGGRRRSEIASLSMEHLEKVEKGYIARLPIHKTYGFTQEPLVFPIFDEAARQLDRWLLRSGVKDGKVFRGINKHGQMLDTFDGQVAASTVRRLLAKAGFPAPLYSTHSLRSGFITQAARDRISLSDAMHVSGHRTVEVAMRYYRAGNITDNPAAHLSLKLNRQKIAATKRAKKKTRKSRPRRRLQAAKA